MRPRASSAPGSWPPSRSRPRRLGANPARGPRRGLSQPVGRQAEHDARKDDRSDDGANREDGRRSHLLAQPDVDLQECPVEKWPTGERLMPPAPRLGARLRPLLRDPPNLGGRRGGSRSANSGRESATWGGEATSWKALNLACASSPSSEKRTPSPRMWAALRCDPSASAYSALKTSCCSSSLCECSLAQAGKLW